MNRDISEEQYQELREDFRMKVNMPFSFTHIDQDTNKDEVSDIEKCLSAIEAEVPGGKLLAEAFLLLNEKFNTIIETIETSGKNITIPDYVDISLSVGGVGFRNNKALLPGDTLKLVLGLLPMPHTMIKTLGVVIRSEEKSDESGSYYEVAVKFQQIDEEERQDITRFLFNVQRRTSR